MLERAPEKDPDVRQREEDAPPSLFEDGPVRGARRRAHDAAKGLRLHNRGHGGVDDRSHRDEVRLLRDHRVGQPVAHVAGHALVVEARRQPAGELAGIEHATRGGHGESGDEQQAAADGDGRFRQDLAARAAHTHVTNMHASPSGNQAS